MQPTLGAAPVPVIRRPPVRLDAPLPRWFAGGSRLRTHLINGMNFVFPAGEEFFIRSVRAYLDQVQDPALRARVAGFIGQEAWHQRAHTAVFGALEAQGLEVQSFLRWYEDLAYGRMEPRFPRVLRLSTTAALEHMTATFGELALQTPMLDDVDPTLRDLLRWHAAEEIEHRDVAYDVLQQVNPSWWVRAFGFFMGLGCLLLFWRLGTRHLLRQDPPAHPAQTREERAQIRAFWRPRLRGFLGQIFAYLRPGFHPRQSQTDPLAQAWIAAHAGA